MYLPNGGVVQNWGNVQEILFLEIALTENWLIFVTRGGNTYPSWQLIGAILAVDALATLFAAFGWLSGNSYNQNSDPYDHIYQRADGWVDPVTLLVVWIYSIFVTIVIAIVYYLLNQVKWLNDLGRTNRNVHDTQMENIIGHLTKLAIEHDIDPKTQKPRYILAQKAPAAEVDE